MKTAIVRSRCECQALLFAALDLDHRVVTAWAISGRDPEKTVAPASARAGSRSVDVTWHCPFCTRNTLRSFGVGGLLPWQDEPAASTFRPAPSPETQRAAKGEESRPD